MIFILFFGAICNLISTNGSIIIEEIISNLLKFISILENEDERKNYTDALKYWENVRTAPNQTIPRKERIEIIKKVINGSIFILKTMIVPAEISRRYVNTIKQIEFNSDIVKTTLQKFCEDKGFAFLSRIKSVESLSEKIDTGRYSKWSELDDILACSIIIPNLSHEDSVIKHIESIYPSDKIISRKTKNKSPEVFRFDTTRYLSHLNTNSNVSLYFEIQIRTVLEHAWITTTHDLVYKYNKIEWRRLRLASELKANLELLDNIILAFEENLYLRHENNWPEIVSKIKIQNFLLDCFDRKLIPNEFFPKDFSRLIDNIFALVKIYPNFSYSKLDMIIDDIISVLGTEFQNATKNSFPRSISLNQYIYGLLLDQNKIDLNRTHFVSNITPELEILFPVTKSVKIRFDYDS